MNKGLINKKTKMLITQGLVLTAIAGSGTCIVSNNNIVTAYAGVMDSNLGQYNNGTKEDFIKNKYLNAMLNYETTVIFSADEINKMGIKYDDVISNYNDFLYDHPEMFYIGEGFSANRQNQDGTFIMYIGYIYDKNEIITKKSELESKINSIMGKYSSYDDLRKVYEFHDYIAENNTYAHNFVSYKVDFSSCKTIDERYTLIKQNKDFYETHSIYGTLINGSSVCEGYAKSLMLLLKQSGMESGIIHNDVHGWNYVKVDGQYYQIDLTGDDGQDTYTSSPYRLFNCSNTSMSKVNVGTSNNIPNGSDITFDTVLRTNSTSGIKGNNVVRIADKLYSLDNYTTINSYDLDCKNKNLALDLSLDSKYALFMKADKNYLYYVSYNTGLGTFNCSIKRVNVDNGTIEEVININDKLGYNSSNLNAADVDFYIENNTLNVDYFGSIKSFKLSYLLNTTIDTKDADNAVAKAEASKSQTDVDTARAEVAKLPDCTEKTDLTSRLDIVQAEIDKANQNADAQKKLQEATDAVVKAETSKLQSDVDTAKALISKLLSGSDKNSLQSRINVVQAELDKIDNQKKLEEATNAVVKAETSKSQTDADTAKDLISKLPSGSDKNNLQNRINVVQAEIDKIVYQKNLQEATDAVVKAETSKSQTDVNAAKTLVSKLPACDDKYALQNRLDNVQAEIDKANQSADAKKKLQEATNAVFKAEISKLQEDVNAAKALIEKLFAGNDKYNLQNRINTVQAEIDYYNRLTDDEKDLLKATDAVVKAESSQSQTDIDIANDLITKLPPSSDKRKLQYRINAIKSEINTAIQEIINQKLLQDAIAAVEKAEISQSEADIKQANELLNKLPSSLDKYYLQLRMKKFSSGDITVDDDTSNDNDDTIVDDDTSNDNDDNISDSNDTVPDDNTSNDNTIEDNNTSNDNSTTDDDDEDDDEDELSDEDYDEALKAVKKFESNLIYSSYKKALNYVEDLPECDEKDDLLARLKKAKRKMDKLDSDSDDTTASVEDINSNNSVTYADSNDKSSIYDDGPSAPGGSGAMISLNNNSFYPSSNGTIMIDSSINLSGWRKNINGSWNFVQDRHLVTGWLKDSGNWYFLDNTGAMQKGWIQYGADWYYLDNAGIMQTGWMKDDRSGKWFFFYGNGIMAHDTKINGYKLGTDGTLI